MPSEGSTTRSNSKNQCHKALFVKVFINITLKTTQTKIYQVFLCSKEHITIEQPHCLRTTVKVKAQTFGKHKFS